MIRCQSIRLFALAIAGLCLLPITHLGADDSSPAQKVPVIDGAVGACSLELTVTAEGKPAYAAVVKVHIAYRFGGFHKLDLQASTNVDGKVKFTGLPAKVRRGAPLEFDVDQGSVDGNGQVRSRVEVPGQPDRCAAKNGSPPAK
jgi:hypothetical protein